MRWPFEFRRLGAILVLMAGPALPGMSEGQENVPTRPDAPAARAPRPGSADDSIQAIDEDFEKQRLELERRRLERLARLASRQDPTAASATYERIFRTAIAENLFRDAGSIAEDVVKKGSPSPTTSVLAHLVKIIAEADRGAYAQSLESLRLAVAEAGRAGDAGAARAGILTSEKIGLLDAYYQRLVHADHIEVARQAFQFLREQVRNPPVVDFVTSRLRRLDLVGKPAPAIRGADVDGKPFDLADARGNVVLVVFWATWCLPSAVEVEGFQQVAESYRPKGLRVVGINLDTLHDGGQRPEAVMPGIRSFLLDHNVRWPTLINGQGGEDYAAAYGVTDIPTNVLIDRSGRVVHIDLVNKNLESVVARAVGR
jgi:thiol-disulfide isomerase/thioredoxin